MLGGLWEWCRFADHGFQMAAGTPEHEFEGRALSLCRPEPCTLVPLDSV
jgi:hypothetical protein